MDDAPLAEIERAASAHARLVTDGIREHAVGSLSRDMRTNEIEAMPTEFRPFRPAARLPLESLAARRREIGDRG